MGYDRLGPVMLLVFLGLMALVFVVGWWVKGLPWSS